MTSAERFSFDLPGDLVAQEPSPARSTSRVLYLNRGVDGSEEGIFSELPRKLSGDECLVVNNTRVIPARIRCRRRSGGAVEAFLLKPLDATRWLCWLSPGRRIKPGEELETQGPPLRVEEKQGSCWRVELGNLDLVEEIGEVPLPPYIVRQPGDHRLEDLDRERYQTVFGSRPGAVAAPTAGLHFDEQILGQLDQLGIPVVPITLHVGPGTFRPVQVKQIEDHRVDPELYEVSAASRAELAKARLDGRQIVAVGTTSLRVLESIEDLEGTDAIEGETDLTILPGHRFRNVDGLITNFHLPRSSLLMLVCAFHGQQRTLAAYRKAIEARFRFYSYGDAMVILPPRISR